MVFGHQFNTCFVANLVPSIRDSPACETDSSEELAILRDAVRLALRVFVNLAQEKSEAVALLTLQTKFSFEIPLRKTCLALKSSGYNLQHT